ncbi:hypothetical protein C8Q76DRAFT_792172 [Earliella scabrosa]|nr:hypothetical protein C8Q76DRAFT_801427 [Earliella scabrosa]KAI0735647.1 hypothetical protein C8Q76DRAFT_792172 [Earliella scabrosa]
MPGVRLPEILPLGAEFQPPQHSGFDVLNLDDVTVAQLLALATLSPLDSTPEENLHPFDLSTDEPVVDFKELHERPVPDLYRILPTRSRLNDLEPNTYRSFLDDRWGVPVPTPLWIIEYWLAQRGAGELRETCEEAEQWLRDRQEREGTRSALGIAATEALQSFSRIPCVGGDLGNGRANGHDVISLFGQGFILGSVVDAMVDSINIRLTSQPGLERRFAVHGTEAWTCIHQWRQSRPSAGSLQETTNKVLRRLKDDGGDLEMMFLIWLTHNPGRWVVFGLDVKKAEIRYGDCRGGPPVHDELLDVIAWLEDGGLGVWTLGPKLACWGPDDGCAGGVAAVNAINHYVFGDALASSETVDLITIEEYLRIVRL